MKVDMSSARSFLAKPGQTFWFVVILVAIAVYAAFRFYFSLESNVSGSKIEDYDACVKAGNAVQESYTSRCTTKDGVSFTQDIGNELERLDLIKVSSPRPNQVVASPLLIEGTARGFWFFEASFPVKLFDANGNTIATGIAQAQSEWMTRDFVPFRLRLEFARPKTSKGSLILEKDNPSGLPQNDDKLIIPVKF